MICALSQKIYDANFRKGLFPWQENIKIYFDEMLEHENDKFHPYMFYVNHLIFECIW